MNVVARADGLLCTTVGAWLIDRIDVFGGPEFHGGVPLHSPKASGPRWFNRGDIAHPDPQPTPAATIDEPAEVSDATDETPA